MSEAAGLLAAVLADPDSDRPRLNYADWLTRQGDSLGELIRVQLALAQLPAAHPRAAELRLDEERLLAPQQAQLLGPLAQAGFDARFERGFITSLTTTVARYLENARELSQQHPIQELCLKDAADLLPALAACPALARIRRLFLTFNALTEVSALAQSPHLGQLVTLNLGHNALGDAGLQALANSTAVPRLADLWLANNGIGDDGVIALARAPLLAQLRTLRLNGNPLGDPGIQALAASPHAGGLHGLHLGATRCTDAGALALAASPHLPALRWLVVKKCPLGEPGAAALRARLGWGFNREVFS